ncbi:MAG: AAA family ATPase [Neisseria sp.]|uniref:ParA family protein n=1 Tax=Neisseria sp. TaxID=192066 RepID=UPI001CABC7CD|nr:AAA family ATPase [Neisseria sp.]MBF1277755.1 AAA family ATPase [Neisseria sp.]
MKIISVFNNKGGVGKSTLTFHLAHALVEKGHKTLMIDLDPQSNLTLNAIAAEQLEEIWEKEDPFIEDSHNFLSERHIDFQTFLEEPRSIHSLLKPIEDGIFEEISIGKPIEFEKYPRLGLIPGRLSIGSYEDKVAKSWGDAFLGDPSALRLITAIRNLCLDAQKKYEYEYVIIDTSPSIGILNRIIISTSTGFFVPCAPDMFSSFGLRNIGRSLEKWNQQFTMLYNLLSDKKRVDLPQQFVKFLGYTIYNAKKYKKNDDNNENSGYDLAQAHLNYVQKLPEIIHKYIPRICYDFLDNNLINTPIGTTAVMHSHNTLPAMSQKYKEPMWKIPSLNTLDDIDKSTISGNRKTYEETRDKYLAFAESLLTRINSIK